MVAALLSSLLVTAPVERVTVAAMCEDSPGSLEIADRAAMLLKEHGWVVERAPDARAEWSYTCRLEHGAALEQLDSGKAAFHKMRFKAARKRLQRAHKAFAEDGWLGTPAGARDVLVYLGWIALEARDTERAREAFAEAVRLWPAWRPGGDEYPPHVVRAYAQVVVEAAARPRGGLAVRTQPAGATVILNGHTELSSPCTFSDLLPGEHTVALRHPDLDTSSRRVTIEAGKILELDVDLTEEKRDDWWRATTAENWQALRDAAPGDVVLVVVPAFAREGLATGVVVGRRDVRVLEVAMDDPDAAAVLLVEAVNGIVRSPNARDPDPDEPVEPRSSSSVLSAWWFWTAVAVVGAGAIAGATYAATRPDEMTITVRR